MSVRLFLSHPIFTKVSTSAASTLVFLLALPVLNAGCPQTAKITATPAQVHLGLERAPATTMVITWRSATPHGEVRYSAEKHPQQRQAAQSTAYAGGYLHHAYLTGLVPNTRYRYRCGHGAHLSASYRFMTAPAPSAATPLRIVALGDSRSNDRVHRRIIRAVLGEKPRIVLHTGDMVQTGDRQDQWDRFFTIAEPLAARVATLSAIGNHERNDGRYYTQLVLPTHGAWPARAYAPEAFYALDYGFLHLIVLSTEPVGPPTGPQTRWLMRDLARARTNTQIRWIIVMAHRPPYSCGNHRGHDPVKRAWITLFEKHGVDLTIWGHDHNYQRTKPLLRGQPTQGGLTYVVTGGAGAPLYATHRDPRMAAAKTIHHYLLIRLTPTLLRLEAKDLSGKTFDHFERRRVPALPTADPS